MIKVFKAVEGNSHFFTQAANALLKQGWRVEEGTHRSFLRPDETLGGGTSHEIMYSCLMYNIAESEA